MALIPSRGLSVWNYSQCPSGFSGFSGFLLQSRDIYAHLNGASALPVGVNMSVDDCALCQSCDELATCLGCNHTSCLDVVSERLKPLNCHSWKNVLPITCLVFCILENISHTAYMHAPYTDSRTTTFGGVLAIFL